MKSLNHMQHIFKKTSYESVNYEIGGKAQMGRIFGRSGRFIRSWEVRYLKTSCKYLNMYRAITKFSDT